MQCEICGCEIEDWDDCCAQCHRVTCSDCGEWFGEGDYDEDDEESWFCIECIDGWRNLGSCEDD